METSRDPRCIWPLLLAWIVLTLAPGCPDTGALDDDDTGTTDDDASGDDDATAGDDDTTAGEFAAPPLDEPDPDDGRCRSWCQALSLITWAGDTM